MRTRAAVGAILTVVAALVVVPVSSAFASTPTCNSYRVWNDAYVPDVASTGSVDCNLVQGDESEGVRTLQFSLNYCYGEHLDADGEFGSLTRAALVRTQGKVGTKKDGQYGPNTRRAMQFRALGYCTNVP